MNRHEGLQRCQVLRHLRLDPCQNARDEFPIGAILAKLGDSEAKRHADNDEQSFEQPMRN